jgi:hypothetical protein
MLFRNAIMLLLIALALGLGLATEVVTEPPAQSALAVPVSYYDPLP